MRARVVAAGMVPFAKRIDSSVDLIAARAVLAAVADDPRLAGVIQEAYFGTSKGGSLIGQRSLRFAGLATGLPIFNVENACASSAVAFHLAIRAIESGRIDGAIVVGVDRLSTLGRGSLPVQETEWDGAVGATNPVIYAMRATRYLDEHGISVEDLAAVTVKSRWFSSRNPVAQMREETTIDAVMQSRAIADPLTMFMCSPKSDGAAAVIVVSDEVADRLDLSGPVVRASVVTSGEFSMSARDITVPDITARAVGAAFEQAGVGPEDLDVVELHDAFSIAELLYTEELGLCPEGGAADALRSGATSSLTAGGIAVVNPSGGLLGRGHPIGATGVAQIVELFEQLTGRSGIRQRAGAEVGLAHVTGGGASGFDNGACAVTVMTAA